VLKFSFIYVYLIIVYDLSSSCKGQNNQFFVFSRPFSKFLRPFSKFLRPFSKFLRPFFNFPRPCKNYLRPFLPLPKAFFAKKQGKKQGEKSHVDLPPTF
jgi:hypothetical protein